MPASENRPVLMIATPSVLPGPGVHWVDRLVYAWPEPRPVIRRMTLEHLTDQSFQIERGTVVLMWLECGFSLSQVLRVLDRISCLEVPVVVLSDEPDAIDARTPAGVLTRSRASDPGLIAVVLRALVERQEAVNQLVRERSQMLSAQAGLMHQMESMLEELTLASQIQRELIPRTAPAIEGLNLSVICRPAGYVSGDLFRIIRLDEEHVGFFLADAVGHGVPAALFTLLISRSLEPVDGLGRIRSAAEVLTSLNLEMVERNATGSRFATGVYGILNLANGKAEIAGAGHPAPIVVRGAGYERLETQGPLLGIFEDAEFDSVAVTLGKDDSLVLFTDGFENAFPSSAEDAYSLRLPTQDYVEQLGRFGRDCCESGSFSEATERFEKVLDAQLGSLHQPDDITALVLSPRLDRSWKREAA